jgi:cation transport ATPase
LLSIAGAIALGEHLTVAVIGSLGDAELLRMAGSLDQVSQHVIAQAIVAAARDRGVALSLPSQVVEQPGAQG